MNINMQKQAYRIDQNVPLLAFDLLARVIAAWIDTGPLFPRSLRFGCQSHRPSGGFPAHRFTALHIQRVVHLL